MKEQYATKRLLLIPANKSLIEAVTDYYVRNRAFFQAYDPVCEEEFFTYRYQRARLDLDEQNAMQAQGYRFYLVKKEQHKIQDFGINDIDSYDFTFAGRRYFLFSGI